MRKQYCAYKYTCANRKENISKMVWCAFLNYFCFVCGHYIPKRGCPEKSNISEEFKDAYLRYYSDHVDLFDQPWTPNAACKSCKNRLQNWMNGDRRGMIYDTPVIWTKDPNGHDSSECYGCINNRHIKGRPKKDRKSVEYTSTKYSSHPVHHSDQNPIPRPPTLDTMSAISFESTSTRTDQNDPDYEPNENEGPDDGPELLTQETMDYLVAILGLSQRTAEFLATFLKKRRLTLHVNATAYRHRQAHFQTFFVQNTKKTFTYCKDIAGLAKAMGINYNAKEWRLFIDGSVNSLKAVLLHISNKLPAIPVAYSTAMKESWDNLNEMTEAIKYSENKWKICGDMKVINIMQGLKPGYPTYFCYLCCWNTRAKKIDHYTHKWPKRTGRKNKKVGLINKPIVKNTDNILLPPLHLKLGIVQKFIATVIAKNDKVFDIIKSIFPKLGKTKIENGKFHSILNGSVYFST